MSQLQIMQKPEIVHFFRKKIEDMWFCRPFFVLQI